MAVSFDDEHVALHGRQLDSANPEDFETGLQAAEVEMRLQLDQPVSGVGWYDGQVRRAFVKIARITGLETLRTSETHRVIWSAISGVVSNGNKVPQNTKIASAVMRAYLRGGVDDIPTVSPAAGGSIADIPATGFGKAGPSVAKGLRIVQHLIKTKGEEGFADWWLSEHTLRELVEVRVAAGLAKGSHIAGKADDLFLGSMIIGDKTGKFSLAISGFDETTKDRWFVRFYNRQYGQVEKTSLAAPKNADRGDTGVFEQPRNARERASQEAFAKELALRLGLSKRDSQAVAWYFEQQLYTDLGVPSVPKGFDDGAEELLTTLGLKGDDGAGSLRASDADQAAAQPGGLEGFREISPAKRAVRDARRSRATDVGRDGPVDPGQAPRAYERTTSPDRPEHIKYTRDENQARRFNKAGVSTPDILEIEDADKFLGAIEQAKKSLGELGAQVETKTAQEYSNARLFLTEDGQAGFAITNDGDIVSVFNATSSSHTRASYGLMQLAVEQGGTKLDAFDTYLPDLYATVGFRPVSRIPWDDAQAPKGWDKKKMAEFKSTFTGNPGEPDLVLMRYEPDYFGGGKGGKAVKTFEEADALRGTTE